MPQAASTASFALSVKPLEDYRHIEQVLPLVDAVSLVDLVGAYEAARGYTPAGGYAGIVPDKRQSEDLRRHFAGEPHLWGDQVPVLGCNCGEQGCWPLLAHVAVDDETVTWSGFRQPHRPGWDYSGFGPFVFDRAEYERAVDAAAAALAAQG